MPTSAIPLTTRHTASVSRALNRRGAGGPQVQVRGAGNSDGVSVHAPNAAIAAVLTALGDAGYRYTVLPKQALSSHTTVLVTSRVVR